MRERKNTCAYIKELRKQAKRLRVSGYGSILIY